jgi:hypothetical protein
MSIFIRNALGSLDHLGFFIEAKADAFLLFAEVTELFLHCKLKRFKLFLANHQIHLLILILKLIFEIFDGSLKRFL